MRATQRNVASVINQFLGQIYGWGGLYGYRDCSLTLHDLFLPFGIWLWVNSADQQKGDVISLQGLSRQQKEKIIQEKGLPFFSLIGLKGHVMLYLGQWNGQSVVFQNMWGIHTFRLFREDGRIIVGKAVITTLQPGKEQWNVFHTQLDRVVTLVNLQHVPSK
jgi:hypothetical protein